MKVKEQTKIETSILQKENSVLHKVAGIISSNLGLEEMLKEVVDIFTVLTDGDSCFIYMHEKDNNVLILKASKNPHPKDMERVKLKIGEGLTGWAAKEKKPASISVGAYNDSRFKFFSELPEDKYEAFLSIPILSKDEVIGVINIQHRDKHEYPEYLINLLFTITKYLGSAVQNAIADDIVHKKDKQLDVLSKISKTVISGIYLNEILQLIVTMTAQIMNSKICSIMLLDEKKHELVIAATQSLSEAYKNKPNVKVGQSISGKVVKEKRAITVLDVTKEDDFMYPEIAKREGIVSMLALPLMIRDKIIGVVNSYTDETHAFTAEEIDMLQVIANQAAFAIENTRLNEEVFKTREELETRKIIERAKGMLMKNHNISEDEAFKKMQKKSMDMRKSMRELAEAIIIASNLDM